MASTATLYERFGNTLRSLPGYAPRHDTPKGLDYSLRFTPVDSAVRADLRGEEAELAAAHLASLTPERRAQLQREWEN